MADRTRARGTRRRRRLIAAAAALLLVIGLVASNWPQDGKAWRVIDGDTLDLAGERIRLGAREERAEALHLRHAQPEQVAHEEPSS